MIWRIITYRSLQRSLIKVARSEGCQVKISPMKFLGRSNAILCAATFSKRTLSDCPDHVTSLGFLGSKRWWIFKRLSPYSCCQLQGVLGSCYCEFVVDLIHWRRKTTPNFKAANLSFLGWATPNWMHPELSNLESEWLQKLEVLFFLFSMGSRWDKNKTWFRFEQLFHFHVLSLKDKTFLLMCFPWYTSCCFKRSLDWS